jgi:hypothetical protein
LSAKTAARITIGTTRARTMTATQPGRPPL